MSVDSSSDLNVNIKVVSKGEKKNNQKATLQHCALLTITVIFQSKKAFLFEVEVSGLKQNSLVTAVQKKTVLSESCADTEFWNS